ncbi:MAG: hypothetical protein U1F61_04950 [Opitutaceae bacterium]
MKSLAPTPFPILPLPTSAAPLRITTDAWPRVTLLAAASWNIVGGIGALLDPAKHFAQLFHDRLSLSDPLVLFFYRCTWINVIAWGAAYLLAVWLPTARLPALAAGAAGKFFYFTACVAAWNAGTGQFTLMAAGMVDLLFVVLFTAILVSTRNRTRQSEPKWSIDVGTNQPER